MRILVLALCTGIIAGLRAGTPLAALGWAVRLGYLSLLGTPLAFLAHPAATVVLTLVALGELVTDKLPSTPSRKVPPAFAGRVISGAFAGAVIGLGLGLGLGLGGCAGGVGAVIGTLGGAAARGKLAGLFGRDLPAALLEDAFAIGASVLLVSQL